LFNNFKIFPEEAQLEAEKTQQEMELRKGFWCG